MFNKYTSNIIIDNYSFFKYRFNNDFDRQFVKILSNLFHNIGPL